jgi:UDP-glucose 4-epimerase
VNEVLRIVAELTGTRPEPVHEPSRAGDVRLTEADVSLAHDLLGYTPSVGMTEGLERTVDHFRAARGTG